MFTVTILEKGGSERRLTFDKDEVSIGRISGNDIILPKGNISKRHARVVVKDSKFIVIDLKSTNGTYVNKERISAPRVIADADKVYIGDFIMRLQQGAGDEADDVTQEASTPAAKDSGPPAATEQAPPESIAAAADDDEEEEATHAIDVEEIGALLGDNAPIEFGVQPEATQGADGPTPVQFADQPPSPPAEAPWPAAEPPPAPKKTKANRVTKKKKKTSRPAKEDVMEVGGDGDSDPTLLERSSQLGKESQLDSVEAVPVEVEVPAPEPEPEPEPEPVVEEPVVEAEAPAEEPAPEPEPEPEPEAEPEAEPAAAAETVEPEGEPAVSEDLLPADGEADDESDKFDTYVAVLELLQLKVTETIFADIDPEEMDLSDAQWEKLEADVAQIVTGAREEGLVPEYLDTADLTQQLLYEFTGLGPIEYFLADEMVTEILVNDFNQIFVTHDGTTEMVWKSFSSASALETTVDKLAASLGFGVDERPPLMAGELPDGSRFQILLPPLAPSGAVLTFQKPRPRTFTVHTLLEHGVLNEQMASYLVDRVKERANIVVSGRRGSGRSTLMNALGYFIPETERIVIVERRPEVNLPHPNVIRLRRPALPEESRELFGILPTLLATRLVVAQASGDDAISLMRLALAGAEGVLCTIFANSSKDLVERLATQAQLGGEGITRDAADSLIAITVDVIVHIEAHEDGVRITEIAETSKGAEGGVELSEIFRWTPNKKGGGSFKRGKK